METYNNFVRGFLGFLTGSFPKTINIETGKDKLDGAFSIFNEAKEKANDALQELAREANNVESDIMKHTKEYEEIMKDLKGKVSHLEEQKARGHSFIEKLNGILG